MSDNGEMTQGNVSSLEPNSELKKFYALFDCEDAEKWANHAYYTWFPGLNANEEEWKWYKIYNGEFPTEEELGRIKGILITGSHHSVNQEDKWIRDLLQFIKDFNKRTKEKSFPNENEPKLIGSCFGCQAIAKALGGVVEGNQSNKFEFKIEEVKLLPQTLDCALSLSEKLKHIQRENGTIRVLESHSESVLQVPENSSILATSSSSPNEIFLVNNNILAIQSHPELSPELALEKIFPALRVNGRITENESESVANNLLTQSNDHSSLLNFLRSFLTE